MNNKIVKEVISYALIIAAAILIKLFIFTPIRVNGTSMLPNLKDGDIMILNEIGYRINGVKRFDIVVAHVKGERLIKRVIGLPGETIEFKYNKLYVNGTLIEENFDHDDTKDFSLEDIKVDKIPDNYYFLVGDNRNNSKDSRVIGLVHKSDISGKASIIIFPFNRIGSVK